MADESGPRIEIAENGPYHVRGNVPVSRQVITSAPDGESIGWSEREVVIDRDCALCRCGASESKPVCDSSHVIVGFDGTETASRESYESGAERLEGSGLVLTDAKELCAEARHCHPYGGVWHEVYDTGDDSVRERVVGQCQKCPSGRYVAVDPGTGEALEPDLPPSIGLVKDPVQDCDGPLWVRGGIPVVSSDGFEYEVRNRVTLCRCGRSSNKPFCDGSHVAVGFREEHE